MPAKKKTADIKENIPAAASADSAAVPQKAPVKKAAAKAKTESEDQKTPKFFFGHGRRKTATARARLYAAGQEVIVNGNKLNKGDIVVNGVAIEKYFGSPYAREQYTEVFRTTNSLGRFITTIKVEGSGPTGQLGATVLAIAHALVQSDPKFRVILRKKGFMTRDPRAKERKKPGLMGARKEKQSPKR